MNLQARPAFAKGVRLRRDPNGAMLLVPEAALMLNDAAAATLELVDGNRSVAAIVDSLVERFDVEPERAQTDVVDLLERLAERNFVSLSLDFARDDNV